MEVYFEVPDSSPTPAPFVSSSDTDEDTADNDDGLDGASSTTTPRAISDDDSGLVGDDASSGEPDDGSVGASSSSTLGAVSTGAGATSGPLPWTFTVMAVGAVSSMLGRAAGLRQA